jgi:F-type H+-transporting ATPase subunit alpha
LNRGQRLVELLKQGQFSPLPFSKQILIIFAGTSGFLDDLPVDQIRDFESELYKYVDTTNAGLLRTIMEKKILDDGLKQQMTSVLKEFKQQFVRIAERGDGGSKVGRRSALGSLPRIKTNSWQTFSIFGGASVA